MIRSLRGTRAQRLLAVLSWAGLGLTVLLAIEGQIGPDPDFNPLVLTVSEYAVADRGGVTDAAMVTFGGSAIALLAAMRGVPRAVAALLCVFAGGMLVAAVAPTDAGTNLSATGYVHRYASVVAFVALPGAGLLLAHRAPAPLGRAAGWVRALALAAGGFMVAMLASATIADRALIGVAERLLLAAAVVLLAVLAAATYGSVSSASAQSPARSWSNVVESAKGSAAGWLSRRSTCSASSRPARRMRSRSGPSAVPPAQSSVAANTDVGTTTARR